MRLRISTKDGIPIYQQIITQIKHMVASGRLSPGEIMLPIRVLAKSCQLSMSIGPVNSSIGSGNDNLLISID